MKKSTKAVHAGGKRELNFGGVNTPVFSSSAIEYLDEPEVRYPRYFNTLNSLVVAEKDCGSGKCRGGPCHQFRDGRHQHGDVRPAATG